MPAALVAVASEQEEVAPGSDASCVVVIRNDGDGDETFTTSIHGPASEWARLDDPVLRLAPGEEDSLWIRFSLPATPMTSPGPVPFSLRVVAESDPSFVVIEAAVVRVAAIPAIDAELIIPARSNRDVPRVRIINTGNVEAQVDVSADAGSSLVATLETASLQVPPGEVVEVDVQVRGSGRGRSHDGDLTVTVAAPHQQPIELSTPITVDSPIGSELLRSAVVLIVVLATLVAGGQALLDRPGRRGATAGDTRLLPGNTSVPPGTVESSDGSAAPADDNKGREATPADDESGGAVEDGTAATTGPTPTASTTTSTTTTTVVTLAMPGTGAIVYARSADLYVVEADGTAERISQGAEQDRMPSLGPDGDSLLFVRDGDIYVMSLRGDRTPRRIVPGASWPTWSPDGSRFAYTKAGKIWVAEPSGANPEQISAQPDGRISWGPGRIVYSASGDIHAVDPDSGVQNRITTTPAVELDPAMAPDGSIVYTTGGSVWTIDTSGTTARRTEGPTDGPASWSVDASAIVFRRGSDRSLYILRIDGSAFGRVDAAVFADVDAPHWGPTPN